MAKKGTSKKALKEEAERKSKVSAIVTIIVYITLMLLALCKAGVFGVFVNNILAFVFGKLYYVPILTVLFFIIKCTLLKDTFKLKSGFYIGLILLNFGVLLLTAIVLNINDVNEEFNVLYAPIVSQLKNILNSSCDFGAGTVGIVLLSAIVRIVGNIGLYIVTAALLLIALILILSIERINKVKEKIVEVGGETIDDLEKQKRNKQEKLRQEAEIARINKDQKILQDITKEEVKPEYVENKSDFSKEHFLDFNNEEIEARKKEVEPVKEEYEQQTIESSEPKALKRASSFRGYKLPTSKDVELLSGEKTNSSKNESSAQIRGRRLIDVLATFGIKAKLEQIHIGPSVTKFEIRPDSNVNLSKISSISDNLKMELAAKSIRIEAPIPGRNAVGIEVPNVENVAVRMSELITKVPAKYRSNKLLFALGKDLMGSPIFCQLNKMPHLLIAGATGSGKSVCINTIITSFLLRTRPDEVKLVLVDPKKVEFTPYHDIPHLLWPVITDAKMASLMLNKIVIIMEERFDAFSKAGVRDITSYNEKVLEHNANLKEGDEKMTQLPYIVVIIDELADLMQIANKEVESSIQRITQLARASGIHLIVATQRPSTDVITGLIKSNIPSRISFAVASSIDSRTILDATGAEKLLGNGDMLYAPQGETAPIRLQGCFVTDSEIQSITEFVKKQAKPEYDDTYFALKNNESTASGTAPNAEEDGLYNEVVEFIRVKQAASTSLLQRRFGIGYNRAARIIDTLEENGLIGPSNGSKSREVYIKKEDK